MFWWNVFENFDKIGVDLQSVEQTAKKFLLAAIIFFGFFSCGYILRLFLIVLDNKLSKTHHTGWNFLCRALANPIFFFGLFIGLFLALDVVASVHSQIKELIPMVRTVSIILFFTWVILVYIGLYEKKYRYLKGTTVKGFDQRTVDALIKLLKATIIISALILGIDAFGMSMKGVLTVAGIGGVSIAFASKDLLANFFGTIVLYIDKPFSVGHKIKLTDGRGGDVEYIGWRMTKLRTDEKASLYVANSSFLTMSIENLSKISHRQIKHLISIRFADLNKVDAITRDITAMLLKTPSVDEKERAYAVLANITDSGVQLKIRAFTTLLDQAQFVKLTQQIIMNSLKIIKRHGALPAFPSHTIEVVQERDFAVN